MEELKLKFVKVFVLIRSYKFKLPSYIFNDTNTGCIDLSGYGNNMPMTNTPLMTKSTQAGDQQIKVLNFETEFRKAELKGSETFYHIDQQKALAHKEELANESVPDYDIKVELSEWVGLTDDEGKTVRVISSWKTHDLS